MSILLLSHWLYSLTQLSWLSCVKSECYTTSFGIHDSFKLAAAQFCHWWAQISICSFSYTIVGFSLVSQHIMQGLSLKLLYKISLSIYPSIYIFIYLFIYNVEI